MLRGDGPLSGVIRTDEIFRDVRDMVVKAGFVPDLDWSRCERRCADRIRLRDGARTAEAWITDETQAAIGGPAAILRAAAGLLLELDQQRSQAWIAEHGIDLEHTITRPSFIGEAMRRLWGFEVRVLVRRPSPVLGPALAYRVDLAGAAVLRIQHVFSLELLAQSRGIADDMVRSKLEEMAGALCRQAGGIIPQRSWTWGPRIEVEAPERFAYSCTWPSVADPTHHQAPPWESERLRELARAFARAAPSAAEATRTLRQMPRALERALQQAFDFKLDAARSRGSDPGLDRPAPLAPPNPKLPIYRAS